MTDLEILELVLLRSRDNQKYTILNTPVVDRKFDDIIVYKITEKIAEELTNFNIERKRALQETTKKIPDITERLKGYAEVNELLGAYTEAKCLYEAIEEIKRLRDKVEELKAEIEEIRGSFY